MNMNNKLDSATNSDQIEQLKVAGNNEFSKGHLELALQHYTEALSITPNETSTNDSSTRCTKARICGNRSLVHAKLGMLEESLQDATQGVSLDKTWPKGYFRLGMALQALQKPEEALMAFELGASFLASAPASASSTSTSTSSSSPSTGDKKLAKEFSQHIARLNLRNKNNQTPTATRAGAGGVSLGQGGAPMATAAQIAITLRREEENDEDKGGEEGVANICVRTLSAGGDNRGVFASRALPARRLVLAVPRKLMLTLQVAREGSSICRQLDTALHPHPSHPSSSPLQLLSPNHCLIAVFMLQDRALGRDHARFWAYYQSLPRDLSSMPVFWSEQELALLTGSWLLQRVEDRKLGIQSDYSEIVRIAPEMAQLASLQAFTAMRMLVNSRVFATEIDGVETMTMVPLVDLLNHRRPPLTEWKFNQDTQAFQLITTAEVAAGEQLFDSYGAKCNSRYLLNYGFTIENNRDVDGSCHNEISFEVSLDPQDPSLKTKTAMMTAGINASSQHITHEIGTNRIESSGPDFYGKTRTSWRLSMTMHFETMTNLNSFCYGRFIFASPRELPFLPRALPPSSKGFTLPSDTERGDIIKPISVSNEAAVLQLFKEKALAQLAAFEHSLEHDHALRPTLTPLSNAWHACNLRIGEKEVCQYLIDVCDECCRLFAMSWEDARRQVQARKQALTQRPAVNEIDNEIVDYLEKVTNKQLADIYLYLFKLLFLLWYII